MLIACGAHALQTPHVTLAGGAAFPVTPQVFTDAWDFGASFGVGASVAVSRRVAVGPEIVFHSFRFDDAYRRRDPLPNPATGGRNLAVLTFGIRAEIALRTWGTTKPFVVAGTGFDRVTRTGSGDATPAFGDDSFSMWAGAGVRTVLTPGASLFADAVYHHGAGSGRARFVPIRIGISF